MFIQSIQQINHKKRKLEEYAAQSFAYPSITRAHTTHSHSPQVSFHRSTEKQIAAHLRYASPKVTRKLYIKKHFADG